MKNWINKIPKEKLQRYVFLGMLILVFVAFFISLVFIDQKAKPDPNPGKEDPIDNPGGNNDKPVELFKLPVQGTDYKVVRKYWYKDAPKEDLDLALIEYEAPDKYVYSPSKGISIAKNDNKAFNVICSMGGVVKKVENSPLYGTVITIEHNEGVITEYSSLASTTFEAGDVAKQGDVLGVSGESEYDSKLSFHVHFKINKDNVSYNPETFVGKSLKDVK